MKQAEAPREYENGLVEMPCPPRVEWRTVLKSKLVIRNEGVRECVAECLGTFILLAFGFASIASWLLSGEGFTPLISVNFGWGFGVSTAVWVSMSVSGAHINPAVTVALVVIGKFPLRKVPHYLFGQYLGGFLAAVLVYGLYYDALNNFDGGVRATTGANATAVIFTTIPSAYLTMQSAVLDQLIGTSLLMVGILAMTDPRNPHCPSPGLFPLCIGLFVASLTMCFALNMGAPINPARDLPSRIFIAIAGWGMEPFSLNNYNYFWIPVVGPHLGAIVGAALYELLIAIHLPDPATPNDVLDKEGRRRSHNLLSVELPLSALEEQACGNGAPNREDSVSNGDGVTSYPFE